MNGIKIREDFQYNIGDYLDFSDENLNYEHYKVWYNYLKNQDCARYKEGIQNSFELDAYNFVGVGKDSCLYHDRVEKRSCLSSKLNPKDVFENFSELYTVRAGSEGNKINVPKEPMSFTDVGGLLTIHPLNKTLHDRGANLKMLKSLEQQLEDLEQQLENLEEEVRKLYYKDEEYKQQIEDYFIKN